MGGLVGVAPLGAGASTRALQAPASPDTVVVFEGVTVVDVAQGRLLADQRVVIAGPRIRSMVRRDGTPPPTGARVVEARGKYLIPGFWDWHAHTMGAVEFAYPLLLANGVTGFRDPYGLPLDSMQQWRREVWAGTRAGPPRQILSSLPLAGLTGLGGCGKVGSYLGNRPCIMGPRSAQAIVDSFQSVGADMLKLYSMGSPAAYRATAAAARQAGILFGGHVNAGTLTAVEASEAGAWIIDHVLDVNAPAGDMSPACLAPTATLASCRAVAETFRRNRTWWVPTLTIIGSLRAYRKYVPVQPVTDTVIRRFTERYPAGPRLDSAAVIHGLPLDSQSVAAVRAGRPTDGTGLLRLARQVGFPLLAGSDASATFSLAGQLHLGFTLHVELAVLVLEGLTSAEALQTATLNAAQALGATDSLGTVAAGKLADLVLLDDDPLADITNTQQIAGVVANGRYFDRAALTALRRAAWQDLQTRQSTGMGRFLRQEGARRYQPLEP